MIDKKLYCETFSRLHASEEAKKEVFQMKENKKRVRMPGLLRTAALAAALAMALAATAGAVNLATDGAFFQTLREVWTDGYETRYETVDEAGNVVEITATQGCSVTMEDGRMILHVAGEDIDITDEIGSDGAYHYERVMERRTIVADVTGTREDWTLVEEVTDGDGNIYRITVTSGDMAAGIQTGTAVISEHTDENGEEGLVAVTVTECGPEGVGTVPAGTLD